MLRNCFSFGNCFDSIAARNWHRLLMNSLFEIFIDVRFFADISSKRGATISMRAAWCSRRSRTTMKYCRCGRARSWPRSSELTKPDHTSVGTQPLEQGLTPPEAQVGQTTQCRHYSTRRAKRHRGQSDMARIDFRTKRSLVDMPNMLYPYRRLFVVCKREWGWKELQRPIYQGHGNTKCHPPWPW